MKAEKIELTKDGLIVDGKTYGYGITKIEFLSINKIKVYVSKKSMIKAIEEIEDYVSPYNLINYENIYVIEE